MSFDIDNVASAAFRIWTAALAAVGLLTLVGVGYLIGHYA